MERFGLTMAVLAFFLLCVAAMWVGWRRKTAAHNAEFAPFPRIPADLDEPLDEAAGLYVATTRAGHWQQRIVAHGIGMRGPATLRRYAGGVAVDRHGARGFFIPAGAVVEAKTAKAIAGKVMGIDGLLVITWRHGDTEVDTGFRGDDMGQYPYWIEKLRQSTPTTHPPQTPSQAAKENQQ